MQTRTMSGFYLLLKVKGTAETFGAAWPQLSPCPQPAWRGRPITAGGDRGVCCLEATLKTVFILFVL